MQNIHLRLSCVAEILLSSSFLITITWNTKFFISYGSMQRLALRDNKGWNRADRKSCFPMSLTSSSSSRDRNKYGGTWRRSINFFKGYSLCYCDRSLSKIPQNSFSVHQKFAQAMFLFSLTTKGSPRRKWKQCLCKILEEKQRLLRYYWKCQCNLSTSTSLCLQYEH